VLVGSETVAADLDVVASAGAPATAYILATSVTSMEKTVSITLAKGSLNNPMLSAVEVIPSEVPPATESPSALPSQFPSSNPTKQPTTESPFASPTMFPSTEPTEFPSSLPTNHPSALTTFAPSALPTEAPSLSELSSLPSVFPSTIPSMDPSSGPSSLPSLTPSSLPSLEPSTMSGVSPYAVRINVGGGAYSDDLGRVWAADNFSGGNSASMECIDSPIAGTQNDPLYCSYQWYRATVPVKRSIPVELDGSYKVRLHFAETVRKFVIAEMDRCRPGLNSH